MAPNYDSNIPNSKHNWGFHGYHIRANENNRVGYRRHSGGNQANYLYVDGHVESLTAQYMLTVDLSDTKPPFYDCK